MRTRLLLLGDTAGLCISPIAVLHQQPAGSLEGTLCPKHVKSRGTFPIKFSIFWYWKVFCQVITACRTGIMADFREAACSRQRACLQIPDLCSLHGMEENGWSLLCQSVWRNTMGKPHSSMPKQRKQLPK